MCNPSCPPCQEETRNPVLSGTWGSHVRRHMSTDASHGALKLQDGGIVGELAIQARELVAVALKNSDCFRLLVDAVLDLEKIESGSMVFEFKVVNLSELKNQALKNNETYAAQYEVVFIPDALPSDVEVMAHPDV